MAASATHPSNRATALGLLGRAQLELGDPARAIAALEEAASTMRPFEIRQSLLAGWLAEARAASGDIASARADAERAIALAERARCPWVLALGRWALGDVLAVAGDPAGATAVLREAVTALEAIPASLEATRVRLALAAALRAAGRIEEAGEALGRAREALAALDAPGYRARAEAMTREWGAAPRLAS
jgi:tetratricopeptide (TPR) repeat protein